MFGTMMASMTRSPPSISFGSGLSPRKIRPNSRAKISSEERTIIPKLKSKFWKPNKSK